MLVFRRLLLTGLKQDIHKNLEGKIAKFHQMEDAILYISCFDANGGIFELFGRHSFRSALC